MDELLTLARKAALEAAGAILPLYGSPEYELKGDNSPVTKADGAANEVLMRILGESGIPILSEESTGIDLPYPSELWIIDPLDGTKGFLNKTNDFSVMIGLIENGRPKIAVVREPVSGKEYFATLSGGSYLTDAHGEQKLTVSTRTQPHLRGLVSVNHAAPYMFSLLKALNVSEEVAVGSIGIKAGYIASDRADLYVNRGALGEWDVCAPELILTEAGGTATDTTGRPLYYGKSDHRIEDGIVFSNGILHQDILDALRNIT